MPDDAFTPAELHDAFLSVANSIDWRKPICRTVTVESDRDTLCILRAIDALAGGGASYSTYTRRDGRRTLTVRAPGYDALISRTSPPANATRTILVQCDQCTSVFDQFVPDADTLSALSALWSPRGFGHTTCCASCDPAAYHLPTPVL
jgi:hypothetical protein